MFIKRMVSEGLSHYSYMIGDKEEAIVIDPRRDCEIYSRVASEKGVTIRYIFETHRNEDYVIGSTCLAALTNAEIFHADAELDYEYGQAANDNQSWNFGNLKLRALSTPGHTPGSMSYLLYDPDNNPWMIFTGDTLFAGDVGRTDLLGQTKMKQLTKQLYSSIFEKILPLGDGVIVCPAHGAGSVCGFDITERIWTTIGLERAHNPKLQVDNSQAFIEKKAKELAQPPYFKKMETMNLTHTPGIMDSVMPPILSADKFKRYLNQAMVLDCRSVDSFAAGHIPAALSIWSKGVSSFAGWLLSYNKSIALVADDHLFGQIVRKLERIGFDNISAILSGGMLEWEMAGFPIQQTALTYGNQFCNQVEDDSVNLLDIRGYDEIDGTPYPGAQHIPLTELKNRLEELPGKNDSIVVLCGSGNRSMTAASILQAEGWSDISVLAGGLSGIQTSSCSEN